MEALLGFEFRFVIQTKIQIWPLINNGPLFFYIYIERVDLESFERIKDSANAMWDLNYGHIFETLASSRYETHC